VGYFRDLMENNENIDESIRPLLQREPGYDHATREDESAWSVLCSAIRC